MKQFLFYLFFFSQALMSISCNEKLAEESVIITDTTLVKNNSDTATTAEIVPYNPDKLSIDIKNITAEEIIQFSKTLTDIPYLYGSTDPAQGFDCSGFITYVFNHFGISVPRSSIDFTNVGKQVDVADARGGDIILFTGTDSAEHFVGHMGIVTENTDSLRFIHSTSGKKYGVTITTLNQYYQKRFVKINRIFKQEE